MATRAPLPCLSVQRCAKSHRTTWLVQGPLRRSGGPRASVPLIYYLIPAPHCPVDLSGISAILWLCARISYLYMAAHGAKRARGPPDNDVPDLIPVRRLCSRCSFSRCWRPACPACCPWCPASRASYARARSASRSWASSTARGAADGAGEAQEAAFFISYTTIIIQVMCATLLYDTGWASRTAIARARCGCEFVGCACGSVGVCFRRRRRGCGRCAPRRPTGATDR